MNFQAGFCPNEARSLLSLCTSPAQFNDPKNQIWLKNTRKHWEKITTETSSINSLSFELGKSSSGPYYLVFRTEDYTLQNIQKDLEISISSADGYAHHPQARIQKSFQDLFEAVIPQLTEWLEIIAKGQAIKLYISGHGRAAAAATLCAAKLKQQTSELEALQIKAYLFGSPRVGNTFFAQELNEMQGARAWCFNVRHSRDLIPFIPLAPIVNPRKPMSLFCFKDVGNLVLLKGDIALQGTTLMGTFSKHRAQWYAHYLRQQFQSKRRLGSLDL